MQRLAIYGLSGAGKSTACTMILDACQDEGFEARVVKLAMPLYRLQDDIYSLVGRPIGSGQQDQQLLRDIAGHLRRINPTFLVEDFLGRARDASAAGVQVVVNDDLKDTLIDYPRLVDEGFKFLHITCADAVRHRRLAARADVSQVRETNSTWRFDRIEADWTIDNSTDSLPALRTKVAQLIRGWTS